MSSVLRIIDANQNRAREALRVLEESARFVLNDAVLTEQLKQLRHDVSSALQDITGAQFNRDTRGDVGTSISTPSEATRPDLFSVIDASGKRLSEALRAMEEYVKTLGGPLGEKSRTIESLRYRGYDLEQCLKQAFGTTRACQWRLCILITEAICRSGDWFEVARASVAAGADCLQLREKVINDRDLLDRARRLVGLCRAGGAALIVNDRPDIALLAGADGVHLGQHDLSCSDARRLFGRQLLIGISTSCLNEAEEAVRNGADYCGLGPMFPTTTKHKDTIAGPVYAQSFNDRFSRTSHLAIGGINRSRVAQLNDAGVQGVAVSSAVCSADDPGQAVKDLLDMLDTSPIGAAHDAETLKARK